MLTIQFEKRGKGIYVPHVDILRALNRTFRRAGIEIAYSQGYNKHMLVNLTQPLPFGIASTDDWVSAETVGKISADDMIRAFNEYCPDYLHAVYCKETTAYPNLSAKVNCCRYEIACAEALAKKDSILSLKNSTVLEYEKKGEKIQKDVTDSIYCLEVTKEGINCILAFGAKNLRIDLFCQHINKNCNLDMDNEDIVRTNQFIFDGKIFLSAKEYMEELS